MDSTVHYRYSGTPITTGLISSAPSLSPSRPPGRASAHLRPTPRHPSPDRKEHPP